MKEKIFKFNLDVKDKEFKTGFDLVQLDNTSRFIIKLFDDGEPYEMTKEDKVEVAIAKNDGTFVVIEAEFYDNSVTCLLTENALAIPGITKCEVRVLNGSKVLTSASFKIYIRENIVNGEAIKSTSEYKALEGLINEAKIMQESLKKGESVIEDVNKIKENLTEIKESILNKSKEIDDNLAVADEKINLIKTYISKSETAIENLTNNQNKIENLSNLLTELEKIRLTLDEINNSVNKANTQKVELDKSTENAKNEKISLDDSVKNSKIQNSNLKNTITEAEMSESSLVTSTQKGLIQQSELEKTISNSLDKDKSLKATNGKADSLKTDLNSLSENISSKITDGKNLKSNIDTSISNAATAKSNLDTSVETATSTNTTLKATDTEAKKTEALIKDLMSQLKLTKDEVSKIIAAGDLSKYVTDPKLQEALKSYATQEDLSKIDVTSQLKDYAKKTEIPTKLSQLTNDKNFKTEIEIQELINNSTKLKKEVVTSLPSTGKEDIIYLLKNKNDNNNFYTEYLWIGGKWEIIGDTKVDLSEYLKTVNLSSTKLRTNKSNTNVFTDRSTSDHQLDIILGDLELRTEENKKNIESRAKSTDIKIKLSEMKEDSTHRTVSDSEKQSWNKKFELPDGKENQVLTKTAEGAEFKNLSRSATFVIANYDSSENSKAGADYVIQENESPCDIINSFIAKLPSYGGKIQLTEGNFIEKKDKSINLNKDNITLSGYGIATKLERTFKSNTVELIRILNSNIILKNLQITLIDNYAVKVFENTNNCKIYNIDTPSTNMSGFNIQGSNHRLLNCTVITHNVPAFNIQGSNHSLSNCSGTTAITTAFNIQGSGISLADCKGKNGSNSPCFWIKNKDHKIINCTAISSAEAFYIEASEISLIGCSLQSSADTDIFCTSASKKCIILANRCYGNGIYNKGTNNIIANNIE